MGIFGVRLELAATGTTHNTGIATSRFEYEGLTTRLFNPLNQKREEFRNALGELVAVRDHENLTITNTMDAVGSLRKVIRDGGRGNIEASMIYDDMGRKIQSNDPDAGSWKTVYNAAGESP